MKHIAISMRSKQIFAFVAMSALCVSELSALELNRYFCDGMVLQRDKQNTIFGTGTKDELVSVTFSGQTKKGNVDEHGRWVVTLEPMPASDQGRELIVSSSLNNQQSTIKNVLVGDVFLVARQSSIDVSLGSRPEGKQAAAGLAENSNFRFIHIKASTSKTPLDNLKPDATTGWQVVDKKSALAMSAAAFYLGRDLVKDVKVPVGIVDLDMGYYFASAWMSVETLEKIASTEVLGAGDIKTELEWRKKHMEAWDKNIDGFMRGKKGRDEVTDKPILGLLPIEMPCFPASCYSSVIHPLRGLTVKGMLLQLGNDYPYVVFTRLRNMGKSTDMAELAKANEDGYRITKEGNRMTPAVLPAAVDDLRHSLGDVSLPVGWIMPPGSDVYQYGTHNREVREVQRRAQAQTKNVDLILPGAEHVPMSGQPADETLLANRCKQWVLGTFYGAKGPVSGPLFDRAEFGNDTATVFFKSGTADGLSAKGDALAHFEVAGGDREFVPCKATIDGSTIKLTSDTGSKLSYVRFGWARKPIQGLVNSAGLPAIPFSTDSEWEYDWWADPAPIELPEEYYTPANKWPKRDYAIINYETEGKGFHLGPTGLWGTPAGPNLYVTEITPGSPADGKVLVGDMIYGLNGTEFNAGDDENYRQFAAGIAKAEAEAGGGKMILNIRRDGKLIEVPVKLEYMGSYSATSPWGCEKSKMIVKKAEEYMRNGLRPKTGVSNDGNYMYGPWNDNVIFLLASGNPELQGLVRRYIRQKIDELDAAKRGNKGVYNSYNGWGSSYLSMLLGEYYHRTGDSSVLPALEYLVQQSEENTPREWPPTVPSRYGLHPAAQMPSTMGKVLAREAGLKVDPSALNFDVRFLYDKRAENGFILYCGYGNFLPADRQIKEPEPIAPAAAKGGTVMSMNGKLGTGAALFSLLDGYEKGVSNCAERCGYAFNKTRTGHGGAWFNNYWTPIGAYHAGKEKYQHFMKGQQWWRELYRDHTGAVWQAHNAKEKESVFAVGFVVHYVVQDKKLRMFGAPRSAFGSNAPAYLKPALAAHRERDYARAENLIQKVLEGTVPEGDLPMVKHFLDSVQTVKKSIDYDLAYTEDAIKMGEYALAKLELPQLKMVVAAGNERLKAIAAALESSAGTKTVQVKETVAGKKSKQKQGPQASKADGEKTFAQELASIETLVKDGSVYIGASKKDRLPEYPKEQCNLWRMTVLETPKKMPEGWEKPGFDDSRWDETTLPIIWPMAHTALLRTTFEVKDVKDYEALHVRANAYKQRNIVFYLNGHLVAKVNNIPKNGDIDFPLTPYALTVLKNGKNSLAVSAEHGLRLVNFSLRLEGRLKDK
jgi:sialate O-acetylesterase